MSLIQMVRVIAPGINVYSVGADKSKNYYKILQEYSEPFLSHGTIVGGDSENGYYSKIDLHVRNCKIFSTDRLKNCHESDPLVGMMHDAQQDMNNFVDSFRSEYQIATVTTNHDLIVMRYEQGEFFKYHNDDSAAHPRAISAVMYFNDDYSGGSLGFKYFNVEYLPEAGDCIVFSAAFPYMHCVNRITKGTRYAAVNWYKYI